MSRYLTWEQSGVNFVVAFSYPFAPELPHTPNVRFWSDTGKWARVNLDQKCDWWIFPVLCPHPKVCESNLWEINIVQAYKGAWKIMAGDYWQVSHYSLAILNRGGTLPHPPISGGWIRGMLLPDSQSRRSHGIQRGRISCLWFSPPIPQPAGYLVKRWGSIKLNPDWFSKEAALREDATGFKEACRS